MSSDFGGAVRAGPVVAIGAVVGAALGCGVGAVTFTTGVGVTQSSGCTIASPVVESNEMTRTPACSAHAASSSLSFGESVSL